MITGERIVIAVAAVVAVLAQVLLAPHISIGFATPNLILAIVIVIAVARAEQFGPLLPFVLGLVYDLLSGGPVGAMAFALTSMGMLSAWFFRRLNNDTIFMAIAVIVAGVLSTEFVYGLFFLMFGYAAGFLEALVYRILPCFVYDVVIAIALYLVMSRFFQNDAPLTSEIRQLQ